MLQFGAKSPIAIGSGSRSPSPTMTILLEITDLFARLASHSNDSLACHHNLIQEGEEALDRSISKLNQSLNLSDNSRVGVLDTVLSLMCFKAPEVFDSEIQYLVETIVTVLSSSISCKVLRFPKDEVLMIGSPISRRNCADLLEACSGVLGKLEKHGPLYNSILCAVVKAANSSTCYRYVDSARPTFDVKAINARSKAFSKLLESRERPFLCVSKEFHERMDWRSIITCLVLSPIMFIETRALLHRWFLVTGLVTVLELLIVLASVILDVVSRPTWWNISLELGAKMLFSDAYFPYNHHLLRILAGSLSVDSLLQLVHVTSEPFSCTRKQSGSTIKQPASQVATIDHKSVWALAINFPNWFYFASALLFSEKCFQHINHSECTLGASRVGLTHNKEPHPSIAAARYIAWILSPVSKYRQDLLADCLVKISESWASKQFDLGAYEKKTASNRKVLKKLKFSNEEYNTSWRDCGCQTVALLIKEFKNIDMVYWKGTAKSYDSCDTEAFCNLVQQQNSLLRRVPLGILLGYLNQMDEDGCELLLHYATCGRIIQLTDTKTSSSDNVKCSHELWKNATWTDECNENEAVAGACLVFSLTDMVESMCASLFETEEAGEDYICLVKRRTGGYLTKCIKRQIQLNFDEDGNLLVMDLCRRLNRWRLQGKEVLEIQKDLDDVISLLGHKISCL
ncbi:hypothetical protein FEM48_Zijuj08G0010600 [Ziziphus jujuba var. spinosa]|uniref:Uncharacterized protein n=1 Tax=Ziziphus jujuba var. spinosa TaxID=714518 RepID=A0A978UW35_ZIZJJ|nr:hypothetical protein FEM48_Zijuj08G0010600 [Ziziphus jujuba var. spinosa]